MSAIRDPQQLTEQVRAALAGMALSEQRMFGGVTFMLNGHMLCCVSKKGLMVRVGKDAEPEALRLPHARPCDAAGGKRPGFVVIAAEGLRNDGDVSAGLGLALRYVSALPPKETPSKAVARRPGLVDRPWHT